MNFTNAVVIINESYKKHDTLESAINFVDAITFLQNLWKRNKHQIIAYRNNSYCDYCNCKKNIKTSIEFFKHYPDASNQDWIDWTWCRICHAPCSCNNCAFCIL